MAGNQFKARIVVETETHRVWGPSEKVSILLDGQSLGSVACGKQFVHFVELGSHSLQTKVGNRESEIINFRVLENDLLNFHCNVTGLLKTNVALTALFRRKQAEPRFTDPNQPRFGRRYTDNVPWHEILNVPHDASLEQITIAYLKLMDDFRSDKIAEMEEVDKQYALSRARKISAAYAQAKKSFPESK